MFKGETVPNLLKDGTILSLAKRHSRTPGQILIRFAIQRGIAVIPKSTNPGRIRENFQITDFELDKDEMDQLMSLEVPYGRVRGFAKEIFLGSKFYPFHDEF